MPLTRLTLEDEAAFAEFFQDFQRNDPINCDFTAKAMRILPTTCNCWMTTPSEKTCLVATCLAAIFGIKINKARFWVR